MNSLRPVLILMVVTTVVAYAGGQAAPDAVPIVGGPALLGPAQGGMMTMHLADNMDTAAVKGAPFCATVTTEHTQSFADGNRVHTADNSTLCRDSEGRTRRDATLNLLGPSPQASAPKLIMISDPVAGVRYMLDPENKVAHKMPLNPPGSPSPVPGAPPKGEHVFFFQNSGAAEPPSAPNVFFSRKVEPVSNEPAPTTENLGDQTINGIRAQGTRMTTTIPAGKIGNDKPINVTSERWYSADLKATVMTKHDDPWAGELKTEFSNVNTSEPDSALFMVPSDYKIVDDKSGPFTIQMTAPAPPPQ
jgi:hypothetical protein